MEFQGLSESQVFKILDECVRYEEICNQWWDPEHGHLPTNEEIAWMTRHEQACGTGVHKPIPPPPGLPRLE